MRPIPRRLGLLLISSVTAIGMSTSVSATAFADTTAAVATSAVSTDVAVPPCEPAHVGSDWRWHDNTHGGHWDRWEDWEDGWEWKHYWRDDHYCHGSAESSETAEPALEDSRSGRS
jgi:hypothetical protein